MPSLTNMRRGAPVDLDGNDLPEPARTQELLRSTSPQPSLANRTARDARRAARDDLRARRDDISDLKRVPEAADFRRDNPDADIHDWGQYQAMRQRQQQQ